jgi:hypothetical protein
MCNATFGNVQTRFINAAPSAGTGPHCGNVVVGSDQLFAQIASTNNLVISGNTGASDNTVSGGSSFVSGVGNSALSKWSFINGIGNTISLSSPFAAILTGTENTVCLCAFLCAPLVSSTSNTLARTQAGGAHDVIVTGTGHTTGPLTGTGLTTPQGANVILTGYARLCARAR